MRYLKWFLYIGIATMLTLIIAAAIVPAPKQNPDLCALAYPERTGEVGKLFPGHADGYEWCRQHEKNK